MLWVGGAFREDLDGLFNDAQLLVVQTYPTLTSTIPTGDKEKLNTSYCDLLHLILIFQVVHKCIFLKHWNIGVKATVPSDQSSHSIACPFPLFSIFRILMWELPDIKKKKLLYIPICKIFPHIIVSSVNRDNFIFSFPV